MIKYQGIVQWVYLRIASMRAASHIQLNYKCVFTVKFYLGFHSSRTLNDTQKTSKSLTFITVIVNVQALMRINFHHSAMAMMKQNAKLIHHVLSSCEVKWKWFWWKSHIFHPSLQWYDIFPLTFRSNFNYAVWYEVGVIKSNFSEDIQVLMVEMII